MSEKHFNLRKLPAFGLASELSQFDFEWPTLADLQGTEEGGDIRMESIEFKSNRLHQLFSVQCSLANGMKSLELSAEGLESENFGTLTFNEQTAAVSQVQSNSSLDGHIYSIWLNDSDGQPVVSYNTTGSGQNGKVV